MLFRKTVTKKQKREASKKRFGILLIFIGLFAINAMLVYSAFIEKPEPLLNPLSKDQTSSVSQLEKLLKDKKIQYKYVATQKNLSYLIKLQSNGEVIIDPSKNIDQQLSSLQLILSQLKIEGKTLKRLDFSYQKPIITF